MDKVKKLKEQLKEIIGADPNFPINGVVTSIENDTCSVELSDGFEIDGVRLKATVDGKDNLLIVPKIGSNVLMLSSDGTIDNLTVIKCDQASKLIFNENGLNVEIDSDSGKVKVKNNSTSLYDVFQDLSTLLKDLKVYTPSGPSGTPLPDSIIAINQFENKFKQILK